MGLNLEGRGTEERGVLGKPLFAPVKLMVRENYADPDYAVFHDLSEVLLLRLYLRLSSSRPCLCLEVPSDSQIWDEGRGEGGEFSGSS